LHVDGDVDGLQKVPHGSGREDDALRRKHVTVSERQGR
jgi:hypothetical protein